VVIDTVCSDLQDTAMRVRAALAAFDAGDAAEGKAELVRAVDLARAVLVSMGGDPSSPSGFAELVAASEEIATRARPRFRLVDGGVNDA
jgi:hypothetical protein